MSNLTIRSPGDSGEEAKKILGYMLDNNESDQNTAAAISQGLDSVEDTLMDLYSRPDKDGAVTVNNKTFKSLDAAIGYFQEKYKKAERIFALFQEFRRNAHDTIMQAIRNLRIN